MLDVKQVSKIYEGNIAYRALTDINLKIDEGEFVGIMGPSGSFLYIRLYMDLDEDKQKFSSIAKMGLTVKELKKVLTRCLYFDAKFNRFSPKFSYIFNNTISIFHVNLLT